MTTGFTTPDTIPNRPGLFSIPDPVVSPAGKRVVLIIAILAGFITPFDGSAVNIALPAIGAEFHMDAIALSWVSTAYLLASAIFLVPFGKIADIYGRKKIFLVGIIIFAAASFVMTLVESSGMLIIVRVLQGIGSSMIFGTAVAILTSVFPPGERGKALGIYITAVYIGLSTGPFLGGLLTEHFGWRSIFYINVPIGIIAIIFVFWKLTGEWADSRGEPFDSVGSLMYASSIVAVMLGFTTLPEPAGFMLIIAGVICAVIFIRYEHRKEFPVLETRLFTRSRVFAYSNLAALINYSATYAVSFLLSLYLQYSRGYSPVYAGFILVAAPVMQAVISPFSGKLSDRINPGLIASIGMGLSAIGLFLLTFLGEATPLWYILGALVLIGIGFGFFTSPNTNAIMCAVEKKYYGVASGIVGTMRLLGQMLSMGIATMIFALIIGHVEITAEYYPAVTRSVQYAFVLFTILCIIGIYASLQRSNKLDRGPDAQY
jgi:EmrB/QacA subfamily drug resistance transporter